MLGWDVQTRAMLVAAVATTLAGVTGLLPALLYRRSAQAVVLQAALGGSAAHMLLSLIFAGIGYALKLGGELEPLAAWTGGLYAASLIALVVALIRIIRAATPHGAVSQGR